MALAKDATSQLRRLEPAENDKEGQSVPRLRVSPQKSDIRELDTREPENDDLEATKAFELIGNRPRHDGIWPPPLALDAAIDQYAGLAQKDSEVLHALRIGDLPQAVTTLLQENFQLRQDIESSRADFEELLSVNLAIQEQADAALGVADDQRLELLDDLEQARGEFLDLESQLNQERRDRESDLDEMRQQRDVLDLENFELKARLADC